MEDSVAFEAASREDILDSLRQLDERPFEQFVAAVWEARGWETTLEARPNSDNADIRARQPGIVTETRILRPTQSSVANKINLEDVENFTPLRETEPGIDKLLFVTTGTFTASAEKQANECNMGLVDGEALLDILESEDVDADAILASYITDDVFGEATDPQSKTTASSSNQSTNTDPEPDTATTPNRESPTSIPDVRYEASRTSASNPWSWPRRLTSLVLATVSFLIVMDVSTNSGFELLTGPNSGLFFGTFTGSLLLLPCLQYRAGDTGRAGISAALFVFYFTLSVVITYTPATLEVGSVLTALVWVAIVGANPVVDFFYTRSRK